MDNLDNIESWEGERCKYCGRAVLPMGIYSMPIDGFCECIFWR